MKGNELTSEYLSRQDCVVITTNHKAFDYSKIVREARLVIDTRNATRGVTVHRDKIVKA